MEAVSVSRYLRFDPNDPYGTFAWFVGISRLAMRETYDRAFDVYDESIQLERERDFEAARREASFDAIRSQMLGWSADAFDEPFIDDNELETLHTRAVAQDYHADYLANIPILFADATIQRFGRNVLGKGLGFKEGFGRSYGDHRGRAPYTFVVRAAANAIRHVGEWDDNDWNKYGAGVVYPALDDASNSDRTKIQSIEILQRAMGIGVHERLRDVVSMKTLILIDGLENGKHSYNRFEDCLLEAAREIAAAAGNQAPELLERQLSQLRMKTPYNSL